MSYSKSKPIPIKIQRKGDMTLSYEPRKSTSSIASPSNPSWCKLTTSFEENFMNRIIKKMNLNHKDKIRSRGHIEVEETNLESFSTSPSSYKSRSYASPTFSELPSSPSMSPFPSPSIIKSEKVLSAEAIHLLNSNSFDDMLEFGYRRPNERNEKVVKTVRVSLTPPKLNPDFPRKSLVWPHD